MTLTSCVLTSGSESNRGTSLPSEEFYQALRRPGGPAMARFEDHTGPRPAPDLEYLRIVGLPFHINHRQLILQLWMMDPTVEVLRENITFFSTDDPRNYGKSSGVCVIGFETRQARDNGAQSFNHRQGF